MRNWNIKLGAKVLEIAGGTKTTYEELKPA